MARIRTVKPEFWQDEKLSPMEPIDRLVFLGLIGMADDAGRLLDNLKHIDAFIFPETEHSAGASLDILARHSRITRGVTASGQKVVQITNWSRHQKVDRPSLRACLPEIVTAQEVVESSRDTRESLAPRPTTYDQRPTTVDRRPEPESPPTEKPAFPQNIEAAGAPYFRVKALERRGEVQMIREGVRGWRVSDDAIARGLSDMWQANVEWRPALLRKWFERAAKLLAEEQAVVEVRKLTHPTETDMTEPM